MISDLSSSPDSNSGPSPQNPLFGLPNQMTIDGPLSVATGFRTVRSTASSPDLARRRAIHETRDQLLRNEGSNEKVQRIDTFPKAGITSVDHSPLTLRMKTLTPGVEMDSFQLSPDNSLGLIRGDERRPSSNSTNLTPDVFGPHLPISSSPPRSGRTSRSSDSTTPSFFTRAIGGFTKIDQGVGPSETRPQQERRISYEMLDDMDVQKELDDFLASHNKGFGNSSPEVVNNWRKQTGAATGLPTKLSPNQKSPSFSERRTNKPAPLKSPSPRALKGSSSRVTSPGTARPRLPVSSPKKYTFEAVTNVSSNPISQGLTRQDTSRTSASSSPWPEVYELSSVEGSVDGDRSEMDREELNRFSIGDPSRISCNSASTWGFMAECYNDQDQSHEESAEVSQNDSSKSGETATAGTSRWALLSGAEDQATPVVEISSLLASTSKPVPTASPSLDTRSASNSDASRAFEEQVVDELDFDVEFIPGELESNSDQGVRLSLPWKIQIRDKRGKLRKIVKGSSQVASTSPTASLVPLTSNSLLASKARLHQPPASADPRTMAFHSLPHSASSALESLGSYGAGGRPQMSELESQRMEAQIQAEMAANQAGLRHFSPHSRTTSNPVLPNSKSLHNMPLPPASSRNPYLMSPNTSNPQAQASNPPRSPGFFPKPLRLLEENTSGTSSQSQMSRSEEGHSSRSQSSLDLERDYANGGLAQIKPSGLVAAAQIGRERQRSNHSERRLAGAPSPGGTLGESNIEEST